MESDGKCAATSGNGEDRNAYLHRAWMRRGVPSSGSRPPADRDRQHRLGPHPLNAHLNEVADAVKQGVYEAGGVPLNLPVVSLGETKVRPTAMLWRNMAAMAMEEMFRANRSTDSCCSAAATRPSRRC